MYAIRSYYDQAQDTSHPSCEILVAYEGMLLDLTPPGAVELQLMPDQETAVLTPASIFDEGGVDRLRITSYNVCYTKLLRRFLTTRLTGQVNI